ncbi:S1C family serine protease [Arthrobacter sp. YAF16]|uniref:S1C family serine protease n=1 Tax=Arthrobacter sp. YAF16 TaxID=3233076 RepID=UPI003F917C8B
MTENPMQGASPDPSTPNGEPLEPGEAAAGASHSTAAEDSARENPTMRLDQSADGSPRPVYPERPPAYAQHSGPETQQFGAPSHEQPAPYGQGASPYGAYGNQPPAGQAPHNNAFNHPANAPKRKAAFGVPTLIASILAAGLVGGGVVAGSNALIGNRPLSSTGSTSQSGTVIVNNKDDVNAITAAAMKASPSVVTIKASSGSDGGTGSGIILDGDGHVLTNTHVVTLDGKTANAAVEVRTSDGKVFSAKIVGTDPLSDLAVIKIDKPAGLVPATLGDSDKLNVGDTAVAIGSPLGLTGTVTDGIVSTLNRTISVASSAAPKGGADNSQGGDQGFQFAPPGGGQAPSTADQGSISINVIQTDAAINPGNSGGALVNSKGEIIGVNVAIASAGGDASGSTSSGNIGVGFSIPINHAKRVAQEIISTGKATHGQLGVSVKSKAAGTSSSGFSVGADVATVEPGSAADKAGIKVGDVITKFQDRTISDPNQLTAAVREQAAGATVKVTVLRGGQEQQLDVTLGAAADQ